MGRWVTLHRFALILCFGAFFSMAPNSAASPLPFAYPEKPVAQASPQKNGAAQAPFSRRALTPISSR